MSEHDTIRPKRRWLRLSLRGLILLVLVLGALLGWAVRRASVQRKAVATIVAAGGQVYYNWQWSPGPTGQFAGRQVRPNATPGWPKWLVDAVGHEYFGHVAYVIFGRKGPSDRDLASVAALSELRALTRSWDPA
jgi:hypothetical protein